MRTEVYVVTAVKKALIFMLAKDAVTSSVMEIKFIVNTTHKLIVCTTIRGVLMKIERLTARITATTVGLRRSGTSWLLRFNGLTVRISAANASKLTKLLEKREVAR